MTVGLRRPPAKPSDLSNLPPAGVEFPPEIQPLRGYVEELGIRLDQLWQWCVDQYRPTQNPSGLSASAGGGLGGGDGGTEDAELLALYALKKAGGC